MSELGKRPFKHAAKKAIGAERAVGSIVAKRYRGCPSRGKWNSASGLLRVRGSARLRARKTACCRAHLRRRWQRLAVRTRHARAIAQSKHAVVLLTLQFPVSSGSLSG